MEFWDVVLQVEFRCFVCFRSKQSFNSRVDDVDDVMLQGHVMQQQSRRRLPSLHAIGRSRCVDLEDTPSEPAWLPPPPSSDHEVDKVDEDEEEGVIPATRYASQDYKLQIHHYGLALQRKLLYNLRTTSEPPLNLRDVTDVSIIRYLPNAVSRAYGTVAKLTQLYWPNEWYSSNENERRLKRDKII